MKNVPRGTHNMRRADCLARRGRLTSDWLIRIPIGDMNGAGGHHVPWHDIFHLKHLPPETSVTHRCGKTDWFPLEMFEKSVVPSAMQAHGEYGSCQDKARNKVQKPEQCSTWNAVGEAYGIYLLWPLAMGRWVSLWLRGPHFRCGAVPLSGIPG